MEILQHPHLQALNNAFKAEGFQLRLVGGVVRDLLRKVAPKDVDLCTDATPQEMLVIGKQNGFNVIETGLQHGTLTFVIDHEPYEITTLRIDTDTDGRHAEVEFTTDFKLDADRRDLTINAMSMDFEGNLFDYFGGFFDLEQNQVRFVGDAAERIKEDYLRILRYFRFAARMDAVMDDETLQVIETNVSGLDQISRERIWSEMAKIFTPSEGRERISNAMYQRNVLNQIGLPNLVGSFNDAVCAEAAVASFYYGQPNQARQHCNRWKMSTAETTKTVWVVKANNRSIAMDTIEDWVNDGVDRTWINAVVCLQYGQDVTTDMLQHVQTYAKRELPVRGQDLLDRGWEPGVAVGRRLSELKQAWVESRYELTREQLLGEVS